MNLSAWKSNTLDQLASEFQRQLYCGMWLFVVAFIFFELIDILLVA